MAHKMSFGPAHLTLANNANDAVHRYHVSGTYKPKGSIKTLSNAMDVGDPNNFPRFSSLLHDDIHEFRNHVDVFSVSDAQTTSTIRDVYQKYNYLLDPHTAVAWAAAALRTSKLPKVVVSTASPLKFADEIESTTGIALDNKHVLKDLRKLDARFTSMSNDYSAFRDYIRSHALAGSI
jgi:threonine synthase